jgi:hypothetical protein
MRQMNTRIRNIYYLVPLFFLSITVLLLFMEFSNRDRSFNIKINQIQLSGTGEQGLENNDVSNVKVLIPGLEINLSKNPMMILDIDGGKSSVQLKSFDVSESGFILAFTNTLNLKISNNESNGIVFDIEYSGSSSDTLIIPAKPTSDLHQLSYLPCYSYTVSGANYMLTAKKNSTFDKTAGSLVLPLKEKMASIVINEIGDRDPLLYYFFGEINPVSTDTYESIIEDFISRAYNGWKGSRFQPERGEWLLSNGEYGLNNNLIASYFSESIKRGRFAQIENVIDKISDREADFNFLSAPFSGNIVDTNTERIKLDDILKKRISNAEKLEDITLLNDPTLVTELSWISSSALTRDFVEFITSLDLNQSFESSVLTGIVEVYNFSIKDESNQYQDLMKLYAVIEEQVFPSLNRIENGLFLSDGEDDSFNTLLSIRTGLSLYEIGQIESNDLFKSIGRNMVISVLALADESGLVPEYIDRDGNKHGESYYGADILYPKLTSNEYYPHLVDLKVNSESNFSVWTIANTVSINSNKNSLTFEFTYPRTGIHHIAIKGIEPFSSLQMNGINWNSDKRFQYYSSGWVYDNEEKTLFIKLTQKRISEKIILNYNN